MEVYTTARLGQIFRLVLKLDDEAEMDQVTPDTAYHWDSFAQVQLVNAIEIEFGINFQNDEIEHMGSYKSALALVERKIIPPA